MRRTTTHPTNPYAGETYRDLDMATMEDIPGVDRRKVSATAAFYDDSEPGIGYRSYAAVLELLARQGRHRRRGRSWRVDDSNDTAYPIILMYWPSPQPDGGFIFIEDNPQVIGPDARRIPFEQLPKKCQDAVRDEVLGWHEEGLC